MWQVEWYCPDCDKTHFGDCPLWETVTITNNNCDIVYVLPVKVNS